MKALRDWYDRRGWWYWSRVEAWLPIGIDLPGYCRLMLRRWRERNQRAEYPVKGERRHLRVDVCRYQPQATGDIWYQPASCCDGAHLK